MKKKIKDLTEEEFNRKCYSYQDSCEECPFNNLNDCRDIRAYLILKKLLENIDITKILETEIEVEDDE